MITLGLLKYDVFLCMEMTSSAPEVDPKMFEHIHQNTKH